MWYSILSMDILFPLVFESCMDCNFDLTYIYIFILHTLYVFYFTAFQALKGISYLLIMQANSSTSLRFVDK